MTVVLKGQRVWIERSADSEGNHTHNLTIQDDRCDRYYVENMSTHAIAQLRSDLGDLLAQDAYCDYYQEQRREHRKEK